MAKQPLTQEQIDVLLQKLSTDENFRSLFQQDIGAAFQALPGSPALPPDLTPGCCLQPAQLAPAEKIAQAREAIAAKLQGESVYKPHILEA